MAGSVADGVWANDGARHEQPRAQGGFMTTSKGGRKLRAKSSTRLCVADGVWANDGARQENPGPGGFYDDY